MIAYAGFVILKRIKESKEETSYDSPSRAASRLKIDDDSRAISPTSDESYTYMSPVSDRSSSGSNSSKKRRSYDKTYRTNEPLKGLPEVEFEEKQWDLDDDAPSPTSEYGSDSKPVYTEPHFVDNTNATSGYAVPLNKRHTYMEPETQTDKAGEARSASNPNLLDNTNRYTVPEYATVNKNRDRMQSQSSVITDV